MSLTGFYVLIIGIVIVFGGFAFAAINMGTSVGRDKNFSFSNHITAMVVMGLGGLTTAVGIIVAIVQAIQHYG